MVNCHFLIPAAGMGKRMGSDRNKLLLQLQGKPILSWTLAAAVAAPSVVWIGVIGHPRDRSDCLEMMEELNKPCQWIEGGETRQESVYLGLQALPKEASYVLIHDGARCLITPDLIDRCAEALIDRKGLIAAIPVKDTIKVVQNQEIIDTPDRSQLWAAQTPQGFWVQTICQAHEKARSLGWSVTDDASLLEKIGQPVHIVMGEETNLKVTTPQDLVLAEMILSYRNKIDSAV